MCYISLDKYSLPNSIRSYRYTYVHVLDHIMCLHVCIRCNKKTYWIKNTLELQPVKIFIMKEYLLTWWLLSFAAMGNRLRINPKSAVITSISFNISQSQSYLNFLWSTVCYWPRLRHRSKGRSERSNQRLLPSLPLKTLESAHCIMLSVALTSLAYGPTTVPSL